MSYKQNLYKFISAYPLLTREQELWEFRKPKDRQNLDKVINANLQLVYKLSSRYSKNSKDSNTFAELFSAGYLGLHHAASKYNSNYPVRFYAYAFYWVRTFILQDLIKADQVIRTVASSNCISLSNYNTADSSHSSVPNDINSAFFSKLEDALEDDIKVFYNSMYENELMDALEGRLSKEECYLLEHSILNGVGGHTIATSLGITTRQVYWKISKLKKKLEGRFRGLLEEA